jgi:hypothetical protein
VKQQDGHADWRLAGEELREGRTEAEEEADGGQNQRRGSVDRRVEKMCGKKIM